MKKIFLAAAALSALAVPTAAVAATVEIQRETFLDNGVAPTSLQKYETVNVSANGTVSSYQCALSWMGTAPTAAELASPAPGNTVPSMSVTGTTAAFSAVPGTLLLTYNGRINPQGMATGNAVYEGEPVDTVISAGAVTLGCPLGGTVTLGYVAPTAGTTVETMDEVCKEARRAYVDSLGGPGANGAEEGYAFGKHCATQSTVGGDPGNPGTPFTYEYVAPSSGVTLTTTSVTVIF